MLTNLRHSDLHTYTTVCDSSGDTLFSSGHTNLSHLVLDRKASTVRKNGLLFIKIYFQLK